MEKPRIIIADTDMNYIIPLQLKFIKELMGQADLEIITDREYFRALFMKPQDAEALIVAEDMYDPSLRKHNVNIFLMTEKPEECGGEGADIVRIFKYISVKEIFDKIAGLCINRLPLGRRQKRETQIIVVTSAVGGAGKTTLALNMCIYLAREFKRILYVDAEHMNSFEYMLENKTAITSPEIYRKLVQADSGIYMDIKHVVRKETFDYLPPFKAPLMSLGLDFSVYEKFILSAKESADYDYIFVDTSSVFDLYKAQLMDIADTVVVVTEQNGNAAYATKTFVRNVNGIQTEKYVFVCNKFEKDKYNMLTSPDMAGCFTVSQYVEYYADSEGLNMEVLSKSMGISQIALLLI